MLVLFALLLPLFLLTTAIVIDVGYWWVHAKKAQIAADACALAAAHELPHVYADVDHCTVIGDVDYALVNLKAQSGPDTDPLHLSTRVRSPYNGDPSLVEATVKIRIGTFFGKIAGIDTVEATRRAVAERLAGEGNYAIYSHSPFCPQDGTGESLIFNGEDMNINGRVHSNGQFLINNADFWALEGTQVFCDASINPHGSARFFGPSYEESVETEPRPVEPLEYQSWPEWFTPAEFGWLFGCTYHGQKIEIDDTTLKVSGQPDISHGGTLPSGTYCATEEFKIGGNNLTGQITALAPKVEVGGNNHDFTSYAANDVLFFAVPNTDFNSANDGAPDGSGPLHCAHSNEMKMVNGNGSVWEGVIFHPCGRIVVDGNSTSTVKGAIFGFQVKVNGNGFNMIGTGGSDLSKDTALVE